jgi:hypothetical protein
MGFLWGTYAEDLLEALDGASLDAIHLYDAITVWRLAQLKAHRFSLQIRDGDGLGLSRRHREGLGVRQRVVILNTEGVCASRNRNVANRTGAST